MIMDLEQDGEICSIILLVAYASDWRFQTQETCSCSAVQGIRGQCDLQLAILRILTRALFWEPPRIQSKRGIISYINVVIVFPRAHLERICWIICSDKRNRKFVATWPTLVSTEFKRRSRSPSQTCTPSPSNTPSRVSLRVSVLQLPCILWLRNAEYCHPHCGAHER